MSTTVPPTADEYLTVEQVAAILHRTDRSIWELTRHRRIPMRRIARTRRVLVSRDELARWLDGAELEIVKDDETGTVVRPKAAA